MMPQVLKQFNVHRMPIFKKIRDTSVKLFVKNCHTERFAPTIFSGIQPTGIIHLGNYLGAVKQWTELQDGKRKTIFSIVDLHAMTLPYDHSMMYNNILLMTATLLACGIDPKKSILYQQSHVLEHTNLCWILSCLTSLPRLGRLSQFKDKAATFTNKSVPTGLFLYPVLQSADILLHRATHVPVGDDQVQHIDFANDLCNLFNGKYGLTFPVPKPLLLNHSSNRLKSLRDPQKKMSKSDKDPKSRINLLDSPDEILNKIKKSVTDFASAVYSDPLNRPGVSNLMAIHQSLTGESYNEIEERNRHIDTGKYKLLLADIIIESLKPICTRTEELMMDKHYLEQILRKGAEEARHSAMDTMKEVYNNIGLK